MKPINLKKELIKLFFGLVYIFLLIYFIRWMDVGKWGVVLILCITTLIMPAITFVREKVAKKPNSFRFKPILIAWVYIVVIIHIMYYLGNYGVWGYIISVLIICAMILWKKKDKYLEVKHHIEQMIFGEPLYKFRERKEKPPSIGIKL